MAERPIPREALNWVEMLRNGRMARVDVEIAPHKSQRRVEFAKAAARPPHSILGAGVGVDGARAFHGFGEAATDGAEREGRDITLWS